MIEPAAVACHDVRLGEVQATETCVVIGGGPIGLLIALVAKVKGARVVLSEVNDSRLKLAASLGLVAINPLKENLVEAVRSATDGAMADCVFEVSGSAPGVEVMTELPNVRGRIVMVAIHPEPRPVNLFKFFWSELKLIGARLYEEQDFDEAIGLAASGQLHLDRLNHSDQCHRRGATNLRNHRGQSGRHQIPDRLRHLKIKGRNRNKRNKEKGKRKNYRRGFTPRLAPGTSPQFLRQRRYTPEPSVALAHAGSPTVLKDRTPTGFHTRRIRHQSEIVNQAITITITIKIIEPEPRTQNPARRTQQPMNVLNTFDLSGKTALVTGCKRGIGKAMAEALAEAGADIIGVSASLESSGSEVEASITSLGRSFSGYACNFSDREAVYRFVETVKDNHSRIDILVNNAGTILRMPAAEHPDEYWDKIMEVNLNAQFVLSREFGKEMIERGSGKIIFTASLLTFQGGITVPGYAASKGGIGQLTMALANEWAGKGVNVNAIAPGYISTDNTEALRNDPVRNEQILARIPAGRWGKPEDFKGPVVFLASEAANYVHGTILLVDGGWMGR